MGDAIEDVRQEVAFLAREYQVELFEKAIDENTIICLKTGAGKTFIAIMLIKELQHEIMKAYDVEGKRTIFLVPKVPLVMQQAEAIREHTILRVGHYYGAMGIDYWDETQWLAELKKNHVLVMTAQILVNMLQSGFMSLNKVNLLIFDECHIATGNHPYCVVMSRYRDFNERPRILGLTASILNGKCSPHTVETQMKNLEKTLYSRIQTAADLNAVNRYATKPKEVIVVCDPFPEDGLLERKVAETVARGLEVMQPILDAMKNKVGDNPAVQSLVAKPTLNLHDILQLLKSVWNEFDSSSEAGEYSTSPEILLKYVNGIMCTLGLWCTRFAVDRFLDDIPRLRQDARDQLKDSLVLLYDILETSLTTVKDVLERNSSLFSITDAVTPKLKRLVELLVAIQPMRTVAGEDGSVGSFRGIIFVEQRIIAWILCEYLQNLHTQLPGRYWFLCPTYVVGHGLHVMPLKKVGMNVVKQNESLHSFRTGVCNVMVATKVVEEGLDIPKCNFVVRFDPPKTFCSYVQSMGRARAEKALYVLLADPAEHTSLVNDVTVYKMIEILLNLKSHNRLVPDDDVVELHYEAFHRVPPYYPAGRDGAVVTMDTAMFFLYRYCNYMPRDRFTQLVPKFRYERNSEDIREMRCIVSVPFCTVIKERIVGQYMKDKKLARKAAAHQACKLLHLAGELNDHLQPAVNFTERYQNELGIIPMENVQEGDPIPGTKKRRQVYEKQIADEFCDSFPVPNKEMFLYNIMISETEDFRQHKLGYFGILTAKPLPNVCPFKLFAETEVIASVLCVRSKFTLSETGLQSLEDFHCFLFRNVVGLATSAMEYAPKIARCSFLIVPITRDQDCKYTINWEMVSECATFKNQTIEKSSEIRIGDVITRQYGPETFRRTRFHVIDVCHDLTPESTFPSSKMITYSMYFKAKYDCEILDLEQPLLLVDYAPNTYNLLHPRPCNGTGSTERRLQHLIPELCLRYPLKIKELRQALYLPCILHRLSGLLLARLLGNRIIEEGKFLRFRVDPPGSPIPPLEDICQSCKVDDEVIFRRVKNYNRSNATLSALLFQTLTTSSADNWSDLERLEVIGDSFLKFSVSVYLFCTFKNLNEGPLSMLRNSMVKNFTLFHLANVKGFPQLLNTQAFLPRLMWLPPCFVIPDCLREALRLANVPLHLWPFAKPEDVVAHSHDLDQWCKELTDRWSAAGPANRDAPVGKTVCPPSSFRSYVEGDDDDYGNDDDDDIASFAVTIDPYTQQLISDKTVADSTEAVIGAMLILYGQQAALELVNWLGLTMRPDFYPWKPPTTALIVSAHLLNRSEIFAGLDELEAKLCYKFNDKSFLRQAMIHPSYTRLQVTNNYQKLEFLGDSILDFLITLHLYKVHPNLSPGDMTDLRSSLVDNVTFGYLTVTNKIHKHLKYSSVNLYQTIERYLSHVKLLKHPKDAVYLIKEDETLEMEEIEVPKVLGDIFEAIAGAIYIDSGLSLKAVWDAFYPMMKDIIDQYCVSLPINPVRVLMEAYPATIFSKPKYEGDTFMVNCVCNGTIYKGLSKNKMVAKQAAAKCALRALNVSSTRTLS